MSVVAHSESRSSHWAGRSHDYSREVTIIEEPFMHVNALHSVSEDDRNNAGSRNSNVKSIVCKLLSHVVGICLTLLGYFRLFHANVEGFDSSKYNRQQMRSI